MLQALRISDKHAYAPMRTTCVTLFSPLAVPHRGSWQLLRLLALGNFCLPGSCSSSRWAGWLSTRPAARRCPAACPSPQSCSKTSAHQHS